MLHSIGGLGIITTGIAIFPMFKIFSLNNLLYSEYSDAVKKKTATYKKRGDLYHDNIL